MRKDWVDFIKSVSKKFLLLRGKLDFFSTFFELPIWRFFQQGCIFTSNIKFTMYDMMWLSVLIDYVSTDWINTI